MATLAYDFANPTSATRFPAHGWATNSQSIKLLWCPMLTLLEKYDEPVTHDGRVVGIQPAGGLPDGLAFTQGLLRLATTLRELHHVTRIACDRSFWDADLEANRAYGRAYELAPIFVDLALIYLRRLPDLLVNACRPYLFKDWHSAPRLFKKWVAHADRLSTFNPKCDFDALRRTVAGSSAWFTALRGSSPLGKKGIRDALEHQPVRLDVSAGQIGHGRPEINVTLRAYASDVTMTPDLIAVIRESVTGLSSLMTGLRSAIGGTGAYDRSGVVHLVGVDDDVVGYWPALDG